MTKECIRCFRTLPLEAFYASRNSDGHANACKACVKLRVRLRYRETKPERQRYELKREARAERKAQKARTQARHRQNNPLKYKARNAVNNALRDGRLTKRPCAGCGTSDRVQAHHHDYSKPLDIMWLCFKCHRAGEHGQSVAA